MASATDFGVDVSTIPDLDPAFAPINGRDVLAEAIARRLQTARGALPFNPDDGVDLNEWLHEGTTNQALYRLRGAIRAECEKDERVFEANVAIAFDETASNKALRLTITIDPVEGFQFTMTARVSEFDFTLLRVE